MAVLVKDLLCLKCIPILLMLKNKKRTLFLVHRTVLNSYERLITTGFRILYIRLNLDLFYILFTLKNKLITTSCLNTLVVE